MNLLRIAAATAISSLCILPTVAALTLIVTG